MTRKLRILRILGALLALFLFVGYFAFSTFLFPPFESKLGVDVAGLVDRKVDFFIARANLVDVFDGFPRLAIEDDVVEREAWAAFSGSPEQRDLLETLGYEELITEIETNLDQLPMGIEPLDLFGGADLAIAGYLEGSRLEDARWTIYGNLSFAGKLAIEALRYPGVLGLAEQGIVVTPEDDYVSLNGPGFTRPLYLTRVKDIAVISNTSEPLTRAIELEGKQFEGSFLAGATYHDRIQVIDRSVDRDELEVFVNTNSLLKTMNWSGRWPDISSQDLLSGFAARFFQLNTVNQAAGVLGIDEGLTLDLHGRLSSELLTPLQTITYRRRAIGGNELLDDYAHYVPMDTSLFVYIECDAGDLIEQFFAAMEPAARELVEDVIPQTGRYRSLAQLIDELDVALKDKCMLIMRPNDYPYNPEKDPPHNAIPVPAMALVAWPKSGGKEKLDEIVSAIGGLGGRIGMMGKDGGSGFYEYEVGGHKGHEMWFPNLDGTGHIGTLVHKDLCIMSNTSQMMNHIHKTWTQGGSGGFPRLSERRDFRYQVNSTTKGANLAVWYNPRTAAPLLRERARLFAKDTIEIDWGFERARNEDLVLRQSFGGRKAQELTPAEKTDFDIQVEAKLNEVQQNITRDQLPAIMAEAERQIVYSEAIQGALLMLSVSPQQFDLALRVMTPTE
jgi:hypothetical protein